MSRKKECVMQDLIRSQQRWTRVKVKHCQGLVMAVLVNVCKRVQNGEVIDRINQHTCILSKLGFSHC